jgi:hypothetical protein
VVPGRPDLRAGGWGVPLLQRRPHGDVPPDRGGGVQVPRALQPGAGHEWGAAREWLGGTGWGWAAGARCLGVGLVWRAKGGGRMEGGRGELVVPNHVRKQTQKLLHAVPELNPSRAQPSAPKILHPPNNTQLLKNNTNKTTPRAPPPGAAGPAAPPAGAPPRAAPRRAVRRRGRHQAAPLVRGAGLGRVRGARPQGALPAKGARPWFQEGGWLSPGRFGGVRILRGWARTGSAARRDDGVCRIPRPMKPSE